MALISIQSGWDGDGKHCDLGDGSYIDVETVITLNIHNWIIKETHSLDEFDQGGGGFRIYDAWHGAFKPDHLQSLKPSLF